MSQARVFFEPIKTLAFGGISAAYAPVGAATTHEVRVFKISNNTQGHMMFTTNTSQDEMFLAAGSFTLYDLQSNINPKHDDKFVLKVGTQFSCKQITAPVSGSVYVECIY
jgi:hypothetical protein